MITGTITATDYLNAQKLHRAKTVRWFYIISGIAILLSIIVYWFVSCKAGIILGCAGIGGAIGELTMSKFILPWKVRRLHSQHKDFLSPFTYEWDSDFLMGSGVSGHSKRPWANYAKYKENESVFLLYHADNIFEVFPKKWFRDNSQMDEFRSLVNRISQT